MGYYIRVLSTSAQCVPYEVLAYVLEQSGLPARLENSSSAGEVWTQIILSSSDGEAIANIERDLVAPESLAMEELEEFADSIEQCLPASAVPWLMEYFLKVRTIYAFQFLSGAHSEDGGNALELIRQLVFNFAPAIGQADEEGFSNEQGDHILWQFAGTEPDWWSMAVLKNGKWVSFDMDLGNDSHRDAFLRGDVPDGVEPSRS